MTAIRDPFTTILGPRESAPWLDADAPTAPCTEDPEAFFSEGVSTPWESVGARRAREMCHGCPFRKPCAQYARDNGHQGIWGGVGKSARRSLSRSA